MAAFTLKNIPGDLHRQSKKRAKEHHSSLLIARSCTNFQRSRFRCRNSCEIKLRFANPDAVTGNRYVIAGDTPAATVSALCLTKILLRPRAKKLPEPTD